MSIRKNLLRSFFTIIAGLSVASLGIYSIQQSIQRQYRNTLDNMILEYTVLNTTNHIITNYSALLQDIQNPEMNIAYHKDTQDLDTIFASLDKTITAPESKSLYTKIHTAVSLIKDYTNRGLENTKKRNFTQSAELLEQINRSNATVHEETANLILSELRSSSEHRKTSQFLENILLFIGVALIGTTVGGSVIFAVSVSDKLSRPLAQLSSIALEIAQGKLDQKIDDNLLNRQDEIGSLTHSFMTMLSKLRENIGVLHEANRELQQSKNEIEKRNEELEKFNKMVINRELKMIELKKEIQALKEKQNIAT